jgi:pentatricopeptide repeat protein
MFNKMVSCDVVSWNAMIWGHVKSRQAQKALQLFHRMQHEDVQPNSITLVGVLNACVSIEALEEGKHAHEHIIESGWDLNGFVGSSLVDIYAKCGSMEDVWTMLTKMPSQNVVTWNAILGGCAMHGLGNEAFKHFEQMCEEDVKPNDTTFTCLLSARNCACLVDEGMHCYVSMTIVYMISAKLEHYTLFCENMTLWG